MLSRKNRFHGRKGINSVYKYGENFNLNNISLRILKRNNYEGRVAVVVSKKVSKSAVVRNKIRRRIYEAVRLLQPRLNGNYDMVINIYNESAYDMKYDDLFVTLEDVFNKAGCLTDRKS